MLSAKERSLLEALEPHAQNHGIEIVTIELTGAKKAPTIRVYIDTPEGVSFDELSSSQAWINEVMDELDPFPGAYVLEVSSPGIDRPLRTPEHFSRFAGEDVMVRTVHAVDGRSKFTGVLKGFEAGFVQLELDGQIVSLPIDDIAKAQVKGKIDFNSREERN